MKDPWSKAKIDVVHVNALLEAGTLWCSVRGWPKGRHLNFGHMLAGLWCIALPGQSSFKVNLLECNPHALKGIFDGALLHQFLEASLTCCWRCRDWDPSLPLASVKDVRSVSTCTAQSFSSMRKEELPWWMRSWIGPITLVPAAMACNALV